MHLTLLPYAERRDRRPEVTLHDLRAFAAVVDEGTFTDAAIELGVSQAAVSRAVARLEAALGATLLRRTSRATTLTAPGRTALAHARTVLEEVDTLRDALRDPGGVLRLGYAWAALGRHTATVQHRWRTDHPASPLELVHARTPTSGLADGLVDVAVVRTEVTDPRVEQVVVGFENRYLAVADDDPLASRRFVRLRDVAGRHVAVDARTGSTHRQLWEQAGVEVATVEVRGVEEWLNLIAAGRAVGVTPDATRWLHRRPGVVHRPVRDADPVAVRLVWWREQPPVLVDALVQVLREAYAR